MKYAWSQTVTFNANATQSSAVFLASGLVVESIQLPSAFTGATISFQGVLLSIQANERGTAVPAAADWVNMIDDSGADITIPSRYPRIIVLTGVRLNAVNCGISYLRLVSSAAEGAARTVTIGGHRSGN